MYEPKKDMSRTATGSAQSANNSRLLAFKNGLYKSKEYKIMLNKHKDINYVKRRFKISTSPAFNSSLRLHIESRKFEVVMK